MTPPSNGRTRSTADGRRILAVAASGLLPGLGHLVAGRRRAALLAALPLLLAVLFVALGIARLGVIGLGAQLTAPGRLALVGIGVEPGLSDIFARYAAAKRSGAL